MVVQQNGFVLYQGGSTAHWSHVLEQSCSLARKERGRDGVPQPLRGHSIAT